MINAITSSKENEEFYNSPNKNVSTKINGMPHQIFAVGIQARDIYLELKKQPLKRAPKCDVGRVFNDKMCAIGR